jgi:hypothetical protein
MPEEIFYSPKGYTVYTYSLVVLNWEREGACQRDDRHLWPGRWEGDTALFPRLIGRITHHLLRFQKFESYPLGMARQAGHGLRHEAFLRQAEEAVEKGKPPGDHPADGLKESSRHVLPHDSQVTEPYGPN